MKKITYVMTTWCPYCKMASRWIESFMEDDKYKDIEFDVIDADNDEEVKNFPHELVPNFWIEGEKVFEGVATKEIIKEVLDKAL